MIRPTRDPTSPKRVVIYARRSIDDGDATCSLPEQERSCRAYAQTIGSVVRVFKENASGVTGFDRPVFQEMMSAAGRREFDVILCLDVSRFGRFDVEERGFWITTLRRSKVEVRFVHDDARLQGEAGSIMGAVLQHSAREHSVKTALRVTMGHLACVERGCWQGGPPPFGYRLVRREGWNGAGRRDTKLVIEKSEAAIVREIYKLYASGKGMPTIARTLTAEGHRTRNGIAFGTATLRSILANPVYKGEIVRSRPRRGRKTQTGRQASQFYRGSSSGVVAASEKTDGYSKDGAAPVIVDLDLWERVQEIARERATTASTGGKPGVFVRLAKCGACGGGLVQRQGRSTKKRRYSYLGCRVCRLRGRKETWGECGLVNVSYNKLLDRVLDVLREEATHFDPESIAADLRKQLGTKNTSIDLAALEAKRKKLAARRRELVIGESEFERAAFADLAAEDERLLRQIDAARRAQATTPNVDALVATAVELAQRLALATTELGEEAIREVLNAFVAKIVVEPTERKAPKKATLTIYKPAAVAFPASVRTLGRIGRSSLEGTTARAARSLRRNTSRRSRSSRVRSSSPRAMARRSRPSARRSTSSAARAKGPSRSSTTRVARSPSGSSRVSSRRRTRALRSRSSVTWPSWAAGMTWLAPRPTTSMPRRSCRSATSTTSAATPWSA
jgi:site-specific DNA recombinase